MEGWLDLSLFRQMRKRCLPAIGGSCYMSVFNFFYRRILIEEDFKIELGPHTVPLDTLNQALKRSTKGSDGSKGINRLMTFKMITVLFLAFNAVFTQR